MFNSVGMIFISASVFCFMIMGFSSGLLLDPRKRVGDFAESVIMVSVFTGITSALIGVTLNTIGY